MYINTEICKSHANITNITYNDAKLPTAYTTTREDDVLNSYTYTYALDGNRLSETDSVNGINREYEYDKNGRLTREDITGNITKSMSYEYDTCGNRITETVTGDENYVMTNTYNDSNRLMKQIKTENGSTVQKVNYYYNKNGSRTGRQTLDYSTGTTVRIAEVYGYDLNNHLTSYQKGHTVTTYTSPLSGFRRSMLNLLLYRLLSCSCASRSLRRCSSYLQAIIGVRRSIITNMTAGAYKTNPHLPFGAFFTKA